MTKDLAVVEKVIELTNSDKINWKNYKDQKPKRTLDALNFARVRIATKYQKRVLALSDGYNKYQSYYALNDQLVIALTKGKRDDQLLLIVGEVNPLQDKPHGKNKFKRRQFDLNLAVYTNDELNGKLSALHQKIHKVKALDSGATEEADLLNLINDSLG